MFGLLRLFLFITALFFFFAPPALEEGIESASSHTANIFLSYSRQLARPYLWAREKASQIYLPFRSEEKSQASSLAENMLKRGFWANTLLYSLPYSMTAGQLAVIPRYVSYQFRETPYHHLVGSGLTPEKTDSFTLMNLNICFLPGELPLFFGGVAPPDERVDGIAALIKKADPDVVCLYEAHEIDSTYSLYEKLKSHYKHFYVDIGPEPFEFNSGLFVASKYDIRDEHFKPFMYREMQEQINKGYFEFKLVNNGKILAHVYTTHLQPYRRHVDASIREKELREIIEDIENEYKTKPDYPIILVGDFNIGWNSEEYQHSILRTAFYSNYTEDIETIDATNRTFTDLLLDKLWNNVDESLLTPGKSSKYFEIIDYALIFDKDDNVDIHTERVETFDVNQPAKALSDHHGLFSTITIKR